MSSTVVPQNKENADSSSNVGASPSPAAQKNNSNSTNNNKTAAANDKTALTLDAFDIGKPLGRGKYGAFLSWALCSPH